MVGRIPLRTLERVVELMKDEGIDEVREGMDR